MAVQTRKRRSNEDAADFAESLAQMPGIFGQDAASSPMMPPNNESRQGETKTSSPNPASFAPHPAVRISARSYTPSRLGTSSSSQIKRDQPVGAPASNRLLDHLLKRNGNSPHKTTDKEVSTPARSSPILSRLRGGAEKEKKAACASSTIPSRASTPRTPQGEDWVSAQSTKRSRVMDEGDLISSAPRTGRAGSARATPSSSARLKAFVETIFSPLYKLFPRRSKGAAATAATVALPATAKTLFPDSDPVPLAPLDLIPPSPTHPSATAAAAAPSASTPAHVPKGPQHSPSTPSLMVSPNTSNSTALAPPSTPLALLNGLPTQSSPTTTATTAAAPLNGVSPWRPGMKSPAPKEQHEYVASINLQDEEFLFLAEFLCDLPRPSPQVGPPLLPAKATHVPHTLVLDLDETLVHCSTDVMDVFDMTLPVSCNGRDYTVYVRVRPHLQTFLTTVASLYEVVLFTASQKAYADKLAAKLDPEGRCFSHRLFREHCVRIADNYVKDLSVLGRPLTNTLIVDNSPLAFAYQTSNAIPIVSWYDDDADRELLKLLNFLEYLSSRNLEDVRPFLHSLFRLPQRTF